MIRLIGQVNGVEINFSFYPPDKFEGIIPKMASGKYIVHLKAIDEAGNKTAFTNIFIYIDFQKMEYKVLGPNYSHKEKGKDFDYIEVEGDFKEAEEIDVISFKELQSQFSYKELVI
jgi:hypothetical protein